MTRLAWDAVGSRFYELGVDRGVLYLPSLAGIPWNGLVSVSEKSTGGDAKPYYYDGEKYVNVSTAEEYEATIEAYAAPLEFGECDGTVQVQNGLFASQQPRKSFGFSYRTLIGNDVAGSDLGYKIHLVYNALAAPASVSRSTTGATTSEALRFSWDVTTLAPALTGRRGTAHFVIDSRYTDSGVLGTVEDALYGTSSYASYLPTVSALVAMFTA